jgi:dienelactone hydrolase
MASMLRSVTWVAALGMVLFLVSSHWLAVVDRGGPAHSDLMLEGDVPATFYLPDDSNPFTAFMDPPPRGERPPAVIVMHGFAGDRHSMSGLSRRLAASGFAVLSIDARGHGANRNPFHPGWGRPDQFAPDLRAATDFLRASPLVDGQHIAVLGHSMGAGAVLDFATRESGLDAAVMVSGGWTLQGPYRPPNALWIYASGDPEYIKRRSDELAARVVERYTMGPGDSVGSHTRGDAVAVVEVDGTDHQGIVWSETAVREIVDWLDRSFGIETERGATPSDPRDVPWILSSFGLLLALPGLGLGLGRLVPEWPSRPDFGRAKGLALLAVGFAATMPLLAVGTPATILSIEVGDVVAAQFALAGIAILAFLWLRRPALLEGVLDRWPAGLLGAALGVMAVFVLMQPTSLLLHRITLTPERLGVFILATLSFLPLAVAFNVLLRRGTVLGASVHALVGRILILLVFVVGIAVGVMAPVVFFMLPALAAIALVFELLAAGLYARSRNLLAIAVIDAAWLAMVTAAIFPIRI